MVAVSPGVDLVGPPLSFVFFGLPIIHKHLSNPMTRRGMKYVISGFAVINENKDNIPPEQLRQLTIRHDRLLTQAGQLKERGKTWSGSWKMNSESHRFKYEAKDFHFTAVAVSQAGQKDCIRNSSAFNSGSGSNSGSNADQPGASSDQPQTSFHFRTPADRDEFLAAVASGSSESSSSTSSNSSEVGSRKICVVLGLPEDNPFVDPQHPLSLQPSGSSNDHLGYLLQIGDDSVSFVSV